MQKRTPATDPDATFTPNQLVDHLRALSGGASPIGVKRIRVEIHAGRLRAARVGTWYWIKFSDFLAWLDDMRVEPDPSTQGRVESRVSAQLRREDRIGGP